jgi:small-conductance mechanosensitive channel
MGSWKQGSGGATEKMTTDIRILSIATAQPWWGDVWHGNLHDIYERLLTSGLRVVLLLIGAVLAARFINWAAQKVTERLDEGFTESDDLVRSEATKHRQTVASLISWVSVVLISIVVAVQLADILGVSVRGFVAPATVVGAALGFGAQQMVKDLLSGFFIILEKQYGFGDLVTLTIVSTAEATGTVENVTLRVTRLRSSDGELFTIPNGQIIKTVNFSKDWAQAVVDIPVPTGADLSMITDVLRQACEHARDDKVLGELLKDAPTLMGVESIEVDAVTLRLVARTLPGKQFEAGRRLRALVVRALDRVGVNTPIEKPVTVGAIVHPATAAGAEDETQGPGH